jgi:hypothetical protein
MAVHDNGIRARLIMALPSGRFWDRCINTVKFLRHHGRWPGGQNTMNDAMWRMKVSGELTNPERMTLSDKVGAKAIINRKLGQDLAVPTLAVLRTAEEVDSYNFPDQCAIKASHASGRNCLRLQGEMLDLEAIKNWLELDFCRLAREANYKDITPGIIVEPLVFGASVDWEYKLHCYNGQPRIIQADWHPPDGGVNRQLLRPDWIPLPFVTRWPAYDGLAKRPANFDDMLAIASTLSADFSYIRVDLYTDGKDIQVGEVTNCSGGAMTQYDPPEGDAMMWAELVGE